MAARSIGKVTLVVGLVAIPLKVFTGASAKKTSFNMLHKGCGSQLGQVLICKKENKAVERSNTERGYQYAPEQFVTFADEELDKLAGERLDHIELTAFVPERDERLAELFVERTNLLGPGKLADHSYRTLAAAMHAAGVVGVGQWRESISDTLVVVRPWRGNLVLESRFYADEVRNFDDIPIAKVTANPTNLRLAGKLIAQLTPKAFDPSRFQDRFRVALEEAVKAKVAGGQYVPAPVAAIQVLDLEEALRRSVEQNVVAGDGPRKAAPRARSRRAAAAV